MNTPRAVQTSTGRAMRAMQKGLKGFDSALANLAKLKGIGTSTASGELTKFCSSSSFTSSLCLSLSLYLFEILVNLKNGLSDDINIVASCRNSPRSVVSYENTKLK